MDADRVARACGVDIWLAFYEEIADERLLARFRNIMSEDERRRELGFHFDRDRKCHVVTRALVRTVLSRYADVAPADWVFSTNPYSKPEITNAHSGVQGLHFNVSHTRGLTALAVSRGRALGVDVENFNAYRALPELASQVFSRAEFESFSRAPEDRKQRRFREYWTLKESYIKARGRGLSIPLDKFSVGHLHPCSERMHVEPELDDDADRWVFWQFGVAHEYLLAICAESGDQVPTVAIRKIVPMVSDERIDVESLSCAASHEE